MCFSLWGNATCRVDTGVRRIALLQPSPGWALGKDTSWPNGHGTALPCSKIWKEKNIAVSFVCLSLMRGGRMLFRILLVRCTGVALLPLVGGLPHSTGNEAQSMEHPISLHLEISNHVHNGRIFVFLTKKCFNQTLKMETSWFVLRIIPTYLQNIILFPFDSTFWFFWLWVEKMVQIQFSSRFRKTAVETGLYLCV